jgi:hypothetical protein
VRMLLVISYYDDCEKGKRDQMQSRDPILGRHFVGGIEDGFINDSRGVFCWERIRWRRRRFVRTASTGPSSSEGRRGGGLRPKATTVGVRGRSRRCRQARGGAAAAALRGRALFGDGEMGCWRDAYSSAGANGAGEKATKKRRLDWARKRAAT